MAEGKPAKVSEAPAVVAPDDEGWEEFHGNAYRCRVYVRPEEGGGYSAVAANLPGVASQGGTEQEALANVVEALAGTIQACKEGGGKIPWLESPREPGRGATARWVFVNV